ncbi:MAG: FMN-binding negative transcriptional regulator [Pseudomonadota bacterium]
MHPNAAFRKPTRDQNIAFARERAFGVLTLAGPDGPLASHVPFVLSPDGTRWEAHLVRSNPILWSLDTPQPALVVVSGADGYVSPDWYEVPDQVPTWNYVAVHLRGTLRVLDTVELAPHAARLSAQFEARLAPKPPWTEEKMDPTVLSKMRRAIVPVAMEVATIEGTWKLNQNKTDEVRARAAEAIAGSPIGQELEALAALMREPPTEG